MKNPKISVIIPVYNGEKTLRQCLDSVLNQAYKNYEVIVVDNNSTDGTKDIIKEFQGRSEKVKYFFENYKSRGAARNAGIKIADSEIIAMTDSDCLVPKNWIQAIIKPIIYENEIAVMGFEQDLIKNYWTKNIQKVNWKFIKRNLNGNYINHLDTKNFAIKTTVIKKLLFNPKLLTLEDFDFYLRLKKIARIRFIPSLKVKHGHKSTFISVIKLNFNRAYQSVKIFKKYKNKKDEPILESISIKNFLSLPFWIILQFIKKPFGEACFILISEVSWRAGILWALVTKRLK